MATILVEARGESRCNPILDCLATVCAAAGHVVVRWRGPFSGQISVSRRLRSCDLAILFNGAHERYQRTIATLRGRGVPVLFVELGWHPQNGTIQVDPQGINAAASWVKRPLEVTGSEPVAVRGHDLLLALQHDGDTQIGNHSPYFSGMAELVAHVARWSKLPVRIRRHPRHGLDARVDVIAEQYHCKWDASPSFAAALDKCRAVASINSSSAVEALARGLPVLCYGEAIYRHEGAVYCMTGDGWQTEQVTAELAAGTCSLSATHMRAALERILAHQWRPDEIATRLPPLVEELLQARAAPEPRGWHKLLRMVGWSAVDSPPIKAA